MIFFIFLCIAFLFGSFPTAFIVAKLLKNIDIRQSGSGNVGATNAFRVLGKGPGFFVFTVDFLKGALPVYLYGLFISHQNPEASHAWNIYIGLGGILGHMFTPFLGFKGGKGVATGAGVLCAAFPTLFLLTLSSWLLCFILFKIVSMASIISLLCLILATFFITTPIPAQMFILLFSSLIILMHKSNIERLISGKESKIINK